MTARWPFAPTPGDLARSMDEWFASVEDADRDIGAFVELLPEAASHDAARVLAEPDGALEGVPVAVKELFAVRGAVHANGSLVPGARRSDRDAAAVERLRAAGAVVVGVTRSHEFGWGITTHHAVRGSTRNPRDPSRVAGGSSGGSAAAVAAGFVPLAVGTDTGGSIRIPAAFCGVLGLKTSLGRISRAGCTPLAPSFDTVGLFARSIELLGRGLSVLAGPDARDPATTSAPSPAFPGSRWSERPFRFAAPEPMQPAGLSGTRRATLDTVLVALRDVGGVIVDVDAPSGAAAAELFVPQIMAEASFVHRRILRTWPDHAAQYGRDVAARLRAAESVGLDAYLAARHEADGVRERLVRAFDDVDVLVDIIGSSGPSALDDPDHVEVGGERVRLLDAMMPSTLLQNLAGLPSLTLPVGRDRDGLPIAVQLTAAAGAEELLLEIGRRLEVLDAVVAGPSAWHMHRSSGIAPVGSGGVG